VLRYTGGKMDWFANGLPIGGSAAATRRAGDAARRDVPTCRPSERRSDVAQRLSGSGWDTCVVVTDDRVVLGLLAAAVQGASDTPVDRVMRAAPVTIRPHVPVEDAAEQLRRQNADHLIVTSSEGRLIGLLSRADAERTDRREARAGARNG